MSMSSPRLSAEINLAASLIKGIPSKSHIHGVACSTPYNTGIALSRKLLQPETDKLGAIAALTSVLERGSNRICCLISGIA